MVNRSRNIGTTAETAVVRYLQQNGFPFAERRSLRGAKDAGDISGTIGVCWEIKGGSTAKYAGDALVEEWLVQTETERGNADADFGVLVMQRAGYGPERCGNWWAITRFGSIVPSTRKGPLADAPVRMTLSALVSFLHENGYGDL